MKSARQPVHAGNVAEQESAARGWTTIDLSHRLGLNISVVEEIFKGDRAIDDTIAERLAQTFKTSVEFWLNLGSDRDA